MAALHSIQGEFLTARIDESEPRLVGFLSTISTRENVIGLGVNLLLSEILVRFYSYFAGIIRFLHS